MKTQKTTKGSVETVSPNVRFNLKQEVNTTEVIHFENVIFRAAADELYGDAVHICTDGSKDPVIGKTGIAFYVEPFPPMKQCIGRARLSDNISVYTTELMAIVQALSWINLAACLN